MTRGFLRTTHSTGNLPRRWRHWGAKVARATLVASAALAWSMNAPAAPQGHRFEVIETMWGAANPDGQLIQGPDGDFYGTDSINGYAFRLTLDGGIYQLHDFADGAYGWAPVGGLIAGADGWFYGATNYGGVANNGVIYRLNAAGTYEVLHEFEGPDGMYPMARLVMAADGTIYGTTEWGGQHDSGTVFKLSPKRKLSVLHSFDILADYSGINPRGIVLGPDGFIHGVTRQSNAHHGCSVWPGCGGIFKLSKDGASFEGTLFSDKQGAAPEGAPIVGSDGYLYGTATLGGNMAACGGQGCGTVWRASLDGAAQPIHRFKGRSGQAPKGRLLQASDGNLYGTASAGGKSADGDTCGTLFRISGDLVFESIHAFYGEDGAQPVSGLVEGTDGKLYGVASDGCGTLHGTFFSFAHLKR